MEFQDDKLKSGQIWEYNTRSGEENSRIIILKVEQSNKGEIIVHIAVNNTNIKNPQKVRWNIQRNRSFTILTKSSY